MKTAVVNPLSVPITRREHTIDCDASVYVNFHNLIERLNDAIDPIEPGEFHTEEQIQRVLDILGSVVLNEVEWRQYVNISKECYTRNLVGHCGKFTLLLLCWDAAQNSPIHDHAGSSCWVKMLHGTLTENIYAFPDAKNPSKMEMLQSTSVNTGSVCYINDSMGVHEMLNPSPDDITVSLHCYAPGYRRCRLFNPITGEARIASMLSSTAPVAPAHPFLEPSTRCSGDNDDAPISLADLVCMLATCTAAWEKLPSFLSRLQLTEGEFDEYVVFDKFKYTRNLAWTSKSFAVYVMCWNGSQGVPAHTHSAHQAYVKVMLGSVKFEIYKTAPHSTGMGDKYNISATKVLHVSSKPHLDNGVTIHSVRNASKDIPAVTVHVYTPPYGDMMSTGSDGKAFVVPVIVHPSSMGGLSHDDKKSHRSNSEASQTFSRALSSGSEGDQSDGEAASPQVEPNELETTLTLATRMKAPTKLYCSIRSFCDILGAIFAQKDDISGRVRSCLTTVVLNSLEWTRHVEWNSSHHTRVLLYHTDVFSVMLTCVRSEQKIPVHGHGSSAEWIKTLSGGTNVDYLYQNSGGPCSKKECSFSDAASASDSLDCGSRLDAIAEVPSSVDSVIYLASNVLRASRNGHEECVHVRILLPVTT